MDFTSWYNLISRGGIYDVAFLSIYLVNQDYPSFLIGLIIGMGPLMSTIGGFIGGIYLTNLEESRLCLLH